MQTQNINTNGMQTKVNDCYEICINIVQRFQVRFRLSDPPSRKIDLQLGKNLRYSPHCKISYFIRDQSKGKGHGRKVYLQQCNQRTSQAGLKTYQVSTKWSRIPLISTILGLNLMGPDYYSSDYEINPLKQLSAWLP